MRKKDDRLREALLCAAGKIADTKGIDGVNIRSIAKETGVAAGTVYNYFANKDEILFYLTETYWKRALLQLKTEIKAGSFCEQIQEIFDFLKKQMDSSKGKMMKDLGSMEAAGRKRMASVQRELEALLISLMEKDEGIRKDIWKKTFTKEDFAEFIMVHMLSLLKVKKPKIPFFLAVVEHIIYEVGGNDNGKALR